MCLVLLREKSHCQHNNTQSAKPLRNATPQQYSVWLRIDVIHNRSTCGCKSRHCLEKRIGNIVERATHKIWHHSQYRQNQPSKRNNKEIIFFAQFFSCLASKQKKDKTNGESCERWNQQRNKILFAIVDIIVQSDECRCQHQYRHYHKILSYNLLFHYIKSKCIKMHIA